MKTKIIKKCCDWKLVKNECRNTVNKDFTDHEPTSKFKEKLLLAEHSPINIIRIHFRWEGIKSWISVHFARHWLGWLKWISTQRTDRTGVNRDKAPQDTPVNMDVEADAQALINVGRVRLCYQASTETREYAEDLKVSIKEEAGEPELSNVLVPNCIYRGGCPEMFPCEHNLWGRFLAYVKKNDLPINSIKDRYDAYNQYFYATRQEVDK